MTASAQPNQPIKWITKPASELQVRDAVAVTVDGCRLVDAVRQVNGTVVVEWFGVRDPVKFAPDKNVTVLQFDA